MSLSLVGVDLRKEVLLRVLLRISEPQGTQPVEVLAQGNACIDRSLAQVPTLRRVKPSSARPGVLLSHRSRRFSWGIGLSTSRRGGRQKACRAPFLPAAGTPLGKTVGDSFKNRAVTSSDSMISCAICCGLPAMCHPGGRISSAIRSSRRLARDERTQRRVSLVREAAHT